MKNILVNESQSIQKILDDNLNEPLILTLEPGFYKEKLYIKNNDLTIIGKDPVKTIICYNDFNYKFHEDGLFYNTFRTSTIDVIGKNVTFKNITVENAAGPAMKKTGTAVALSIYGTNFKAINCHIKAHQDTLFIGPLPVDLAERYFHILTHEMRHTHLVESLFVDCQIFGNVDFIFGSGIAIFKDSEIHIINVDAHGYITAPSTYEAFEYGFIFKDSRIINHCDKEVYLGRPWREFGATHFIDCHFIGLYKEERYTDWDKEHIRFFESPYVTSKLSNPLNDLELEKVNKYINEKLNH
ncbi:Pectinesterase [Alteracholeplasma palmae J233]|uniref:Pectinesterase n=1 Tax=Alteracholeplasma palmae (strain ATCC 49389 / J233) TaxID=1318466 RepID=U4KRX4_ALTPJ|nr:pectinesterase family protein [Alteracholeplasma palmae]CCV64526.1 Pectinesterase [Alteracholeplasma palmae J233]